MITVYSRDNCQYCDSAKTWLKNRNINFRDVNIDHDATARDFMLAQGHRSVPQFYVGPRLLVAGGWSALQKLSATTVMDLVTIGNENITPTNLGTL